MCLGLNLKELKPLFCGELTAQSSRSFCGFSSTVYILSFFLSSLMILCACVCICAPMYINIIFFIDFMPHFYNNLRLTNKPFIWYQRLNGSNTFSRFNWCDCHWTRVKHPNESHTTIEPPQQAHSIMFCVGLGACELQLTLI